MATAELVLESAIDALTRRTLVVASLLGKLKADTLQAPGFGCNSSANALSRRGLVSINGTWPSERLCWRIGSASQAASIRSYRLVVRSADKVASGMAAWLSCREADVSRVESPTGAVAVGVGGSCSRQLSLMPVPHSSPWLRFQSPLIGRVESWRAVGRVRWLLRRFRTGPQSGSRGHVSSSRLVKPSMPISGTGLSCCLRLKGYVAVQTGSAFGR